MQISRSLSPLQPARQEKTARHGQSPAHGCKSLHCYCSMATILITNDILPDCDKHDLRCPLSWTYDLSHGPITMLQHALRQELLE